MTRPQDHGDEFPSDLDDVAPASPTANAHEDDANIPRRNKLKKIKRLQDFNPKFQEDVFAKVRHVYMGRIIRASEGCGDDYDSPYSYVDGCNCEGLVTCYDVLLQTGEIKVCKAMSGVTELTYTFGDPCIVIVGEAEDEWLMFPVAGTLSVGRIFFTIISVAEYGASALCQITLRPYGQTTVAEEDEYGQVTVYDDGYGCLLSDEEPDALVGRAGSASYMQGNMGTDADGYADTNGGHWTMDGLCCPPSA